MHLRFGDHVLDTDARELKRAGQVVPLSPKAFGLLEVLAEQRPRAVSKTELRQRLWPDTMAGGTTLARLVNEVRSAVGDQARPGRVIRTVPRFGYAFCATADEAEPAAPRASATTATLQWGERLVPLDPGENIIGRTADALISVASSRVSHHHARIVVADGRATIEDLRSKNGTYLQERRVDSPTELAHGDRIEVGPVLLIFRVLNTEETAS